MTYVYFREKIAFGGLLLSLTIAFSVTPFIEGASQQLNGFIVLSLLFSTIAVGETRTRLLTGIALAAIVVGSIILLILVGRDFELVLFYACVTVYFGYLVFVFVEKIFKETRVNTNLLLSAISVYLSFGVIWAMLYGLIEFFIPGSYNIGEHSSIQAKISDLMYFSIVTLTTLGYGDIQPLSAQAKSTAAMEALVGQIYLTVIVARLVGLHIADGANRDG